MSYLVLARKWRPQVFEEVIGQDSITKTLVNSISKSRISHAILFTGVRGTGKTTIARIFAKALNCEKGPNVRPCNECPNCKEISNAISMDVLEIDGASNTSVNNIRELRENVMYLPSKSKFKIYIIDEVHMLSESAFNALLKTLEEPPDNVVFMFATTEPEEIPQTIISRCQRFDLKPIPEDGIVARLKEICGDEKFKINEYSLKVVAREARGSMRDALSILDKMIAFGGDKIEEKEVVDILGLVKREILRDTASNIIKKDSKTLLHIVDQLFRDGYDPRIFLSELLEYFRNLLVLKIDESGRFSSIPQNELEEMVSLSKKVSSEELQFVFEIIKNGLIEVSKTDYPRFILELAMIRASSVVPLAKVDEAIRSLRRIEDSFTGKGESVFESVAKSSSVETDKPLDSNLGRDLASESEDGSKGKALSEVNIKTDWPAIIGMIKERKPYLVPILEKSSVFMERDVLNVCFDKDSFDVDMVSEPKNVDFIEGLLEEKYKFCYKIKVLKGTDKQTVKENGFRKVGPVRVEKEPKRKGEEASAVKQALNILGGKVDKERF